MMDSVATAMQFKSNAPVASFMIDANDAASVVDALAKNLAGVAMTKGNFEKLPDTFWGYYARGHDSKGKFGVIITYSENGEDVDNLMKMYEQWLAKSKSTAK